MSWLPEANVLLGRSFGSRRESVRSVRDFVSRNQGRTLILVKGSSGRDTAAFRCAYLPCPMRIRARRQGSGDWKVLEGDFAHVNCTGSGKLTTVQVASLAHVAASIEAQPCISGPALQRTVQSSDGVIVPNYTMYRAKNALQACTVDQYNANVSRLPAYLRELERLNPGTNAHTEWEVDGSFKRAFILLGAVVQLAQFSIPVSTVDSSFLKCKMYNGQVAVWEFIDPALRRVPGAVCVYDVENLENYTWMLAMCKVHGLAGVIGNSPWACKALSRIFVSLFTIDTDKPLHVVFSDRSKGLLGALDSELPDAYSQICTRHLMKNVPSLTVSQEGLIWGMQSARRSFGRGPGSADPSVLVRAHFTQARPVVHVGHDRTASALE